MLHTAPAAGASLASHAPSLTAASSAQASAAPPTPLTGNCWLRNSPFRNMKASPDTFRRANPGLCHSLAHTLIPAGRYPAGPHLGGGSPATSALLTRNSSFFFRCNRTYTQGVGHQTPKSSRVTIPDHPFSSTLLTVGFGERDLSWISQDRARGRAWAAYD